MSLEEFSEDFYKLELPSSGSVCNAGSFIGAEGELKCITCWVLVQGTSVGTETFTLGLYGDAAMTAPLATSTRSIVEFAVGSNGYNTVRYDFTSQNINVGQRYYIGISSTNYTNTGAFNVGFLLDWPEETYDRAVPNQTSIRFVPVTE